MSTYASNELGQWWDKAAGGGPECGRWHMSSFGRLRVGHALTGDGRLLLQPATGGASFNRRRAGWHPPSRQKRLTGGTGQDLLQVATVAHGRRQWQRRAGERAAAAGGWA
jgi:hypothetical protein